MSDSPSEHESHEDRSSDERATRRELLSSLSNQPPPEEPRRRLFSVPDILVSIIAIVAWGASLGKPTIVVYSVSTFAAMVLLTVVVRGVAQIYHKRLTLRHYLILVYPVAIGGAVVVYTVDSVDQALLVFGVLGLLAAGWIGMFTGRAVAFAMVFVSMLMLLGPYIAGYCVGYVTAELNRGRLPPAILASPHSNAPYVDKDTELPIEIVRDYDYGKSKYFTDGWIAGHNDRVRGYTLGVQWSDIVSMVLLLALMAGFVVMFTRRK